MNNKKTVENSHFFFKKKNKISKNREAFEIKHQTLNNVHLRTELKIFLYIISLLYESSIIIFFTIILLYHCTLEKGSVAMLYNLCACVFFLLLLLF